jgi:hypothetical protein
MMDDPAAVADVIAAWWQASVGPDGARTAAPPSPPPAAPRRPREDP